MQAEQGRSARLVGVDALRGVAAMLVLLHHLPRLAGPFVVLKPLQAIGWCGVGLFLVLSGFSIHFRWAERGTGARFDQGRFWRRRFRRLYPTYVAAVVLAIVIGLLLGDVPTDQSWVIFHGNATWEIAMVGQALVLLANVFPTPYVGVDWSLALEIQLYAVYAWIVMRVRHVGVQRMVLISLAVSLVWRVGVEVITPSTPVEQFFADGSTSQLGRLLYAQLPSRWFEWMLGFMVAEAYFGRMAVWRPLRRFDLTLVLLIVAGYLFRYQHGLATLNGHQFFLSDVILDPLFGVASAGALLWAVGMTNLSPGRTLDWVLARLAWVGLFSYSLYLTHVAVMGLASHATDHAPAVLRAPLLFAVAVLSAWLFYLAIERRYLKPGPERRARPVSVERAAVSARG